MIHCVQDKPKEKVLAERWIFNFHRTVKKVMNEEQCRLNMQTLMRSVQQIV